ncbi:helix-turn-helix domain-containing protein [Kitasatospora acidiphila]|uniref:Helix-turn-helix domain-containing protein n=1 Tax=Kitasatospora acidiphila TaxID=2567942 RepID=A0A540W6M6_9ACTN|nr:helix-turn-helix transcriptional regulator [Kitasatospora acidiphila]TQF04678.1 helix-turn-helix domain-containing protein [Kitasatospora acidiphila]
MGANAERPMAWRYCGNQVKLWRERSGVSREQLAEESNYDLETVKSMELGRRRPTYTLLNAGETLCDARGMLLAATAFLKPEKFPSHAKEFMAVEDEAIALHAYSALLIPGLLQTPAYAQALMADHCPPFSDDVLDERVAARIERQGKLTRNPPALFGFVIYEAALRTLVGGEEVMKNQFHHLLAVGKLRNVSIQVLPVGRGAHSALAGPFILLETPEHQHYAYVEGHESGMLSTDAERLSVLTQRHGMIRMQALGVEDSARFISTMAEAL